MSQEKQRSFQLDQKDFPTFRTAMRGRWKAFFLGIAFLISYLTIFSRDWKLGLCIYLAWMSAIETAYAMDKNK